LPKWFGETKSNLILQIGTGKRRRRKIKEEAFNKRFINNFNKNQNYFIRPDATSASRFFFPLIFQ
jgi:hypothetical protein